MSTRVREEGTLKEGEPRRTYRRARGARPRETPAQTKTDAQWSPTCGRAYEERQYSGELGPHMQPAYHPMCGQGVNVTTREEGGGLMEGCKREGAWECAGVGLEGGGEGDPVLVEVLGELIRWKVVGAVGGIGK